MGGVSDTLFVLSKLINLLLISEYIIGGFNGCDEFSAITISKIISTSLTLKLVPRSSAADK